MSVNDPTLSTTPNQTSFTLGQPGTLNDTADLQFGFNPTGSITFTLIGPDGVTVVHTETVLVHGNGLYSTSHGFTPGLDPGGPTLAGTYQWNASYSGDTNNNTASDNNDLTEQVTVSPDDSLTLSTTPNQTSFTLGQPGTLNDTADLRFGFNPTGTITFTLIGPDGTTVVDTEMVLVYGNGLYSTPTGFTPSAAGTYQWNAAYSGDTNNTAASDNNDLTEQVTVTPCYCPGTLILTDRGEVAVEDLAIGDRLVTLSGEARPIRWIGHRAYDGRFIAGNRKVIPIRIAPGALAEGVPSRDLWLSPEHSVHIDGVLVRAGHLINGVTIAQADRVERLEYFHIELDSHDVIFADGAPAETYVDCDNRNMFQNAGEFAALYPQDARPRWQFCLPRLEWDDPDLAPIRAALFARAAALGDTLDGDPDLHLVVDGEVVHPERATGCLYRFIIPAGSAAVRLVSRSTVPAEVEPESRDVRRLGVAIERLVLQDAALFIEAGHAHAALCDGFHEDEDTHRWTDGGARLPQALLRAFADEVTLDVHLAPSELGYRVVLREPIPDAIASPARPKKRRAARHS